jgi:hypothetical protein
MTFFHQFSVFAASRGEGLHPKLRALLERAAASPSSEVSMRHDGLIQAGPSPDSEVVSSRNNVTPFREGWPAPLLLRPNRKCASRRQIRNETVLFSYVGCRPHGRRSACGRAVADPGQPPPRAARYGDGWIRPKIRAR